MNTRKHFGAILASIGLLALLAGCATSPARHTEDLLTKSGFKSIPATTSEQQQQMHTLPADKLSPVKRENGVYYVFPDHARNRLYVGSAANYQKYQQLLQNEKDAAAREKWREAQDMNTGDGVNWDKVWGKWGDD